MVDADEFDDLEHGLARVNGVKLHYVTAGEGPPLVLLHGWPQTWYEWRAVIPDLAADYTVIAPDLRGMGDSETPAAGYDKDTVATDVRELVYDLGFGDESIALVGHDWGWRRPTPPSTATRSTPSASSTRGAPGGSRGREAPPLAHPLSLRSGSPRTAGRRSGTALPLVVLQGGRLRSLGDRRRRPRRVRPLLLAGRRSPGRLRVLPRLRRRRGE